MGYAKRQLEKEEAPTLTDAEREALEFFGAMEWPAQSQQIKARSGTLRGLLKRLSQNGNCPTPDNAEKPDTLK